MSLPLYHKQDLFLPNLSAILRNVTVPTSAAWNTLSPYNYYIYGKAFRLYNSSTQPTNLLLLYETDYPSGDSNATALLTYLIIILVFWPIFPGIIGLFANFMARRCGISLPYSSSLLLFRLYSIFGMINKQLNLAARHGHLPNVELCLKCGADVNRTDDKSYLHNFLHWGGYIMAYGPFWTVLHVILSPIFPIFDYFQKDDEVKKKKDRESEDQDVQHQPHYYLTPANAGDGITPLMWAVRMRHHPAVTFLLQQGADVKRKNVRVAVMLLNVQCSHLFINVFYVHLGLFMSDNFYSAAQVEVKNASDFAVRNLRYVKNKADCLPQYQQISILVALINADPDWDPIQLLFDSERPLIDVLVDNDRLFLLAGINLTFERISAHDYALLFVIIQCDVETINGISEVVDPSFDTMKTNLEVLVKKRPSLLSAKVRYDS